ncbi:replication/maintenance protein RepL [Burkholderia contaminans]|jgi:transcription initiation factor IIE alpha subunit|uniref:replication/maintenance protein RepL n=1 Tax=Burkholderia contaminans TaxID=488447 RepID=UPI002D7E3820|nr:replication/maintenance protein RepL [Burkholderia contaminans]
MALTQQIVDNETGEVKSSRNLGENSNFVMIFRNEMHGLRKIAIQDGKALSIFMLLTEHMDHENSIIVSRETISEILEISIPTVDRKLKFLKDNNFITVLKSGTANIYTVNANIAWTTYANKREYAKFKTNILISRTEQEYKLKSSKAKQLDLL